MRTEAYEESGSLTVIGFRVEENAGNLVGAVGHVDDVTISSALAAAAKWTLEAHP